MMFLICEAVSIQQQECVGINVNLKFEKKTVLLNDRQMHFNHVLVTIWNEICEIVRVNKMNN